MRFLLPAIFITLLMSCSVERPKGKTEAEVLYKEAQELVADKRYILATEKLNTLKSQYPYSYFATFAELMIADVLYLQENYEEAAAAYILFKDFHPKHKKIDYVIFRIAESYYNQKPDTFDRDLTPAIKAIRYYNELRSLFPGSSFLKDASEKIRVCEEMLMNKEKYIANFYFKTEDYESARFRYKNMLNEVNSKSMKLLALERLMMIGEYTADSKFCARVYSENKRFIEREKDQKVFKAYNSCSKTR